MTVDPWGIAKVLILAACLALGAETWAQAPAPDDSDYHPATMGAVFPVYTEPGHDMYACDKTPSLCKDTVYFTPETAKTMTIYDCRNVTPPCDDGETLKISSYHVSVWKNFVQVAYQYRDNSGRWHKGDGWIDADVMKEKNPEPFDYEHAKLYPREGSTAPAAGKSSSNAEVAPQAIAAGCKDCAEAKKKVGGLAALFSIFGSSGDSKSGAPTTALSVNAGDRKNCPADFEAMKGPGGFDLSLERKTIQGPASYLGGDGPWYYPVKSVAQGSKKDVCEVRFPGGCGQSGRSDPAPIFKLDWLKSQLRGVNQNVCSAALAKFNEECDPDAKKSLKDRRSFFLKAAADAVNAFEPEKGKTTAMRPYSEKPSKHKDKGPPAQVPLVRNSYLSPHLVQCLMQRENYEFLPTKLNFTECAAQKRVKDRHGHILNGTVLHDKEGRMVFDSHANGLCQVVESVAGDLFDRKVYGNYCDEFAGYWTQLNKASNWSPQCQASSKADELTQNMSQNRMLQIPICIETLNYDLVKAQWNLSLKSKGVTPSQDQVEELALKEFWFHTHDKGDWDGVMSCRKCMDDHGSNPCCLQKSRMTDKSEACKW